MNSPLVPAKGKAVSAKGASLLAARLKLKKGGKTTTLKTKAPTKMVAPGKMDAEDLMDGGVDEATEKK